MTGLTSINVDLDGKRLEILKAALPAGLEVPTGDALSSAFDAASRAGIGAVMVLGSPLFRSYQRTIAELGHSKRIPVVSAWRELPDAGGFRSYGTSVPAMFRRATSTSTAS